jgi:hypothetical protein
MQLRHINLLPAGSEWEPVAAVLRGETPSFYAPTAALAVGEDVNEKNYLVSSAN